MVIGFNDGGGDLWGRCHGERELRLASVVDGKALQEEGAEARAGSTTSGVEDHKALESSAIIRELADAVKDEVNNLLSDGVVTTGVVVSGIFLAGDELFGVIELAVGTSADLIAHRGLEINEDGAGHVPEKKVLKESSPPPTVLSEGI